MVKVHRDQLVVVVVLQKDIDINAKLIKCLVLM